MAFSLAYTAVEKGHIAVELLVDHLPARPRSAIEGAGYLASAGLFGLIAWQSQVYARDLMETGEVSLTLGVPTWPFVFGITIGCGMITLVLLFDGLRQLKRGLWP